MSLVGRATAPSQTRSIAAPLTIRRSAHLVLERRYRKRSIA